VGDRAKEYKESGAFAGAGMDQLRVMGYLDLLNGVSVADRIARAIARAEAEARATDDATTDDDSASDAPASSSCGNDDTGNDDSGTGSPGNDDLGGGDGDPDPGGPGGGGGPGDGRPGGPAPSPAPSPEPERVPSLKDLIVPLRTLLDLARRPGKGHGLGPLDPGLALDLAAAAALSLRSEWCVTITDAEGIAIGHGCARPGKHDPPGQPVTSAAAYPARVNLTIPLSALPGLSAPRGSPGSPRNLWAFTPRAEFPAAREVTLYVLAGAGHNHNVEPGRERLWAAIINWAGELGRQELSHGNV